MNYSSWVVWRRPCLQSLHPPPPHAGCSCYCFPFSRYRTACSPGFLVRQASALLESIFWLWIEFYAWLFIHHRCWRLAIDTQTTENTAVCRVYAAHGVLYRQPRSDVDSQVLWDTGRELPGAIPAVHFHLRWQPLTATTSVYIQLTRRVYKYSCRLVVGLIS